MLRGLLRLDAAYDNYFYIGFYFKQDSDLETSCLLALDLLAK